MCKDYIDPTGHFLGTLFAWVGKVVIGGVVNAVVDTGVRLLTGQEVSLKTIGSSFVEGCVASAVGTGTAKLASKATSAVGKYAINKAGGAAARTAVGVIRGDSAKDIAKSVGVGFLADNVLDGISSKISKIRTQRRTPWPPNDGFAGKPKTKVLKPGTIVDRYGKETGSFVSPKGTSYNARSLRPGTSRLSRKTYVVNKPVTVQAGKVAPAFNRPGGGIQYNLPNTVSDLRNMGVLIRRWI